MANNEVEKITQLKAEMQKCYEDVATQKEEEEKQCEQIQEVKVEINSLRRLQSQSCELEEDIILRKLMNEFEDLQKTKEEQEERLDNMRFKNKELEEQKETYEQDIIKQTDNITRVTGQINDTKAKTKQKDTEKNDLDSETLKLREEIKTQKALLAEKKNIYQEVKAENKNIKSGNEGYETAIKDKSEKIRKVENETSSIAKNKRDQENTNKHQQE